MAASFGRSLENYKNQQRKVAESKGVLQQLLAASTLTSARKIVYGVKSKKPTHTGGK